MSGRSGKGWLWLAGFVAVACSVGEPHRPEASVSTKASALPTNCSLSGFTVTCTFTTGFTAFDVPKGVSSLHVVAIGGMGGSVVGAIGGLGAEVTGDVAVTGGTTIFAVVGGNGSPGAGGYNGGGGTGVGGAGGGGATDLRSDPSVASRMIVAAGGGGGGRGGFRSDEPTFDAHGGYGGGPGTAGGGGLNGGAYRDDDGVAEWLSRAGDGGGGAGAGSGGGGGAGGDLYCAFLNECDDPNPGCHGVAGALGAGGTGGVRDGNQCTEGGGGGGGGRYGGGGGGGGDDKYGRGGAGGGGGGSNLVPAGGSAKIDATGVPGLKLSYSTPLVVSPSALVFGDQPLGSTSADETATVTVTGTAAVAFDSVTLGGANAGDFAISSDTCSVKSIAAGGTCAVKVTFSPTALGARSATLTFRDDATDSPQVVTLTGNGTTLGDVGVAITGPRSARRGSQNTYLIEVGNAGPSTALAVTMTTRVPAGTRFAGVSTTRGTCTGPSIGATTGTITCALGDLEAGATAVDAVSLRFALNPAGGTIALTAQASSASTPDPAPGNNVASILTTVRK